jgi:ABC-type uncharacterized transport system substrate-binding protein
VADRLRGFRQGLKESGYIENENVAIAYRWAENQPDRLQELATDLVRRRVAVIATAGPPATFAAKAATSTIPILFLVGDDPARLGLVASLARPGGNLTGINIFNAELAAKRLELLRELVPRATRVAVLVNPADVWLTEPQLKAVKAAAPPMGLQIQVLNADSRAEIDAAFETIGRERPDAIFVGTSPFLNGRRVQLTQLAAFHRIPSIYALRECAEVGGLMTYTNLTENDPEGQARIAAFLQGLQQMGWTDGRNVRIDTRWTAGDVERFRKHAAELAALAPDVIFATGGAIVGPWLQAILLQPHHDAVGRAAAIHYGEPHEAGPFRLEEERATSSRSGQRRPVHQHGQRPSAARHLERDRIGLAGAIVCKFEPGAIGREHDAKLRFGALAREHARPEALQRRRQLAPRCDERTLGRGWQRRQQLAGAGKGVKQDRRRGNAPYEAWHRRAIGAADPNADGALAVEAHRPSVAVSVRRAGLERDAAAGSVLRRRRAEEDAADIPGGNRIQEPAWHRRLFAARCALGERQRGAEPREPGERRSNKGAESTKVASRISSETRSARLLNPINAL